MAAYTSTMGRIIGTTHAQVATLTTGHVASIDTVPIVIMVVVSIKVINAITLMAITPTIRASLITAMAYVDAVIATVRVITMVIIYMDGDIITSLVANVDLEEGFVIMDMANSIIKSANGHVEMVNDVVKVAIGTEVL